MITERQCEYLDTFLKLGSIRGTARAMGVTRRAVKIALTKPHVAAELDKRLDAAEEGAQ